MAAEHHDLCYTQALESTAESEQQPGMDVRIMYTLNVHIKCTHPAAPLTSAVPCSSNTLCNPASPFTSRWEHQFFLLLLHNSCPKYLPPPPSPSKSWLTSSPMGQGLQVSVLWEADGATPALLILDQRRVRARSSSHPFLPSTQIAACIY